MEDISKNILENLGLKNTKEEYEPLENLGFGLNHWDGKTSIFSQISIDTISVEGNNSLKLSSSLSVVEDSLLERHINCLNFKGINCQTWRYLKN